MLNNPYCNRGAIVSSDEFVGRNDILAECLALITEGNAPQNISVYGDKWSGKTWLLRTIEWKLKETTVDMTEHLCIFLDVQAVSTPRTFYGRLNRELASASKCSSIPVDDSAATLKELVRHTSSRFRTVAILDGFDSITRNPNFPVDFFSFLRSLPMTDGSRFGWLLSSTRPLREMCHSPAVQGSPFFNIFSDRLLDAFTADDSYRLIADQSMRAGAPLERYVEELQLLAGRFPLFIQMACCFAFEQHQQNNGVIDLPGISQKFRDEVRPYIQHLWSRLQPIEQEVLERVASDASVIEYSPGLLRDLVRRGYLVGPSLDSGRFAYDCRAFSDFVRQIRVPPTAPCVTSPAVSTATQPVAAVTERQSPPSRVRVFISYSHRNKRAFRQIYDYICSLSKNGVEFWFDDRLGAGDIWDEKIRMEVSRADVAVVLASQEYFTSRYCMEVEAAEFIRSRASSGMIVFPIMLSPCPIEEHEWLFKTHRLPREGTFAQFAGSKAKRDGLLMQILGELARAVAEVRGRRSVSTT